MLLELDPVQEAYRITMDEYYQKHHILFAPTKAKIRPLGMLEFGETDSWHKYFDDMYENNSQGWVFDEIIDSPYPEPEDELESNHTMDITKELV